MIISVIGSGGREHAICKKISESPQVSKIYCVPGNAGTSEIAENIEKKESEDIKINNNDIDLSEQIVEPETKKENVTVIKESSLSKLKGRLKNKDSLKEAVILKEILDRKY